MPPRTHASRLLPCGLTLPTLKAIEALAAEHHVVIEQEEIFAAYMFLYQTGSIELTAYTMRGGFQETMKTTGWSDRSAWNKIPAAIAKLFTLFDGRVINCIDDRVIMHPFNTCPNIDSDDARVIGVLDTVPIKCFHYQSRGDEDYSGKYCEYVWKLLVICTLSGFPIFVPPTLYSGRSGDSVLYDDCKAEAWLIENLPDPLKEKFIVLCDGAFQESQHLMAPHSGPKIWPRTETTDDEYYAAGQSKLRENATTSHYRARAEHIFSRVMFGRFRAFKGWTHKPSLCHKSVVIALAALSLEIMVDHGAKGKYRQPVFADVKKSFDKMCNRYPEPKRGREDANAQTQDSMPSFTQTTLDHLLRRVGDVAALDMNTANADAADEAFAPASGDGAELCFEIEEEEVEADES
jgi:hypothetical protein